MCVKNSTRSKAVVAKTNNANFETKLRWLVAYGMLLFCFQFGGL